jgi:SAM-dependent methyltransferase
MQAEAYHELHALEAVHWWYVGARAVYRTLLGLGFGPPAGNRRMLEVGCGSGGNLALLEEWGPTAGAEVSGIPLKLVEKAPAFGLVRASADALPFVAGSFDGVHLLGVIEHLPDDQAALQEARRVCRADGAVTLLTSAFPILWSHHDLANGHKRRYRRLPLGLLLKNAGLEPLKLTYQNFFTFLPTLVVRLWQHRSNRLPEYDMGTPPPSLNAVLTVLVRFEAWLIRFLSLPFGVDLVAVCRPTEIGR